MEISWQPDDRWHDHDLGNDTCIRFRATKDGILFQYYEADRQEPGLGIYQVRWCDWYLIDFHFRLIDRRLLGENRRWDYELHGQRYDVYMSCAGVDVPRVQIPNQAKGDIPFTPIWANEFGPLFQHVRRLFPEMDSAAHYTFNGGTE